MMARKNLVRSVDTDRGQDQYSDHPTLGATTTERPPAKERPPMPHRKRRVRKPVELDRRFVELLPAPVAQSLRAIPVDGDADRIVLLCRQPLSAAQLANLRFTMPGREITEADPADYPELYRHLDDLLARYYPRPKVPPFFVSTVPTSE